MAIINKKSLREEFKKENLKIGDKALRDFVEVLENIILEKIELKVRETRINGRKVVR